MSTIVGKIRNILFSSDNGYLVALFRVKKTDSLDMKDFLNKTITINGSFINPNTEAGISLVIITIVVFGSSITYMLLKRKKNYIIK